MLYIKIMAVITLLLFQIVNVLAIPQSPCPDYFSYERGNLGDTIGVISVPTDHVTLPIKLKVQLAIRVALKTKYVGILMLSEHPTLVLGKLLTSRAERIQYIVRFPLPNPLPFLQKIEVNKRVLCIGENITTFDSVFGAVTTKILLEHTFPATPITLSNKIRDDDGPPYVGPVGLRIGDGDNECGASQIRGRKMSGDVTKNSWPWLAAIFLKDHSQVTFQCAGSLISDTHLVTAAHCIKNHENKNWDKTNFVISFGNHNIEKMEDLHSQIREVDDIIIHPEYNVTSYAADIAVLGFERVKFNEYVRPVCIWDGDTELKTSVGNFGTVVGWGIDEVTKKMKKDPQVFQLPIVDQAECVRSRKEFMYITSNRTICAGWRNGTGPCNGDSGSGLLILSQNRNSFIWYLRGLISLTLLDENQNTCDLNEYVVFTDVARYRLWLRNVTHTN